MFVTRPFSYSLHAWSGLIGIGQSPHLRSLYQVYHSHADITNRICWIRWIRWLSLHRPIVPWWSLMRHTDTACRESRFKTCRMCSSSIFWAEDYREYMAKPCVKSMAKQNSNITSLQCQETGDLLRQGREKCTGFQRWFSWKVSWKDSNCHVFCSYLNLKWRNKYP